MPIKSKILSSKAWFKFFVTKLNWMRISETLKFGFSTILIQKNKNNSKG